MLVTCDRTQEVSRTRRSQSLGAELERVRLGRRVSQLEIVIDRLSERVQATDAGQVERAGLKRAIGDFHDELRQMCARLAELAVPGGSGPTLAPAPID
jgi:hypothetical protein